jgi:hypothetical protein
MAFYRGRKALYEVMGKSRYKYNYGKALEPPYPEKSPQNEPPAEPLVPEVPRWLRGPKIFQLTSGRIEISLPYQVAIAILMGVVLLFLVVFRLGQLSYSQPDAASKVSKPAQKPAAEAVATARPAEKKLPPPVVVVQKPESAASESKKNNRIVIKNYPLSSHLEPVKQYFAEKGIETEIRKFGDAYLLVTKEKYDNPERPGTDGYAARQKIIELGVQYKAPPGFDQFGAKPFHDAYGMKFDD